MISRLSERVMITCAVTGNRMRPDQHPRLPVTPKEIADSALEAGEAGAAIVHIHVRDPLTGRPSMEIGLYHRVVEHIRTSNPQLIINLTTRPGGRFVPSQLDPRTAADGTTLLPPEKRVEHIVMLRPDLCTLDLNTMNAGQEVVINTPYSISRMAEIIRAAGVRPEVELFDTGDIALCRDLLEQNVLEGPILCSLVMGVRYGMQASPEALLHARNNLPADSVWTACGVGRSAFPMVAQSVLAGGNIRVGLEDAVYIERGVLAPSNAAMVRKARSIAQALGAAIVTPEEARERLDLPVRLAGSPVPPTRPT